MLRCRLSVQAHQRLPVITGRALKSVEESILAEEPDRKGQDEGDEGNEQVLSDPAAQSQRQLIEDCPLAEVDLETGCVGSGRR